MWIIPKYHQVKRNRQVERISSVIEGSIFSCLGFLPLMNRVDFVWWTLFSPSANLRFSLFTLQSPQRITLTAKGRKSDQELVEVRGALWFSYVFALNRNECNWVAQGWLGVFKKTTAPLVLLGILCTRWRFDYIFSAMCTISLLIVITWSKIK